MRRSVALAMSLLLLLAFTPLTAFAAPAHPPRVRPSGLRALSGGEDIGTAVTLSGSPVTGSLNALDGPTDDVYKIQLAVGQILNITLNGPAGSMFWADILRPGSTSIMTGDWIAGTEPPLSENWYPQTLRYVAGTSGWHYIDVYAFDGAGAYTMTWSVTSAPISMDRYAGSDRCQTAIQVSQAGWGAGSTRHVVLATGWGFADALAASALAGTYDCPILLTPRTSLPSGLVDEIDRLRGSNPATITIVGGSSAVDNSVQTALAAHPGFNVTRIAGSDRYQTAAMIGAEVSANEVALGHAAPTQAFVCSGEKFPDALAVSPFAARMKMPVLLTKVGSTSTYTQQALANLHITKAFVIGGTPTISQTTMDNLAVGVRERIYGIDRFDTAATVAEYGLSQNWAQNDRVGFATARNFPDALGGGAFFGKMAAPLLLTESGDEWPITDAGYDFVANHASTLATVRVLGSHKSVSDALFGEVLDARSDGLAP